MSIMRCSSAVWGSLLPLLIAVTATADPLPRELAGTWAGRGDVVVSWTSARVVEVSLTIEPDGTVGGRIGDAELQNGRIARNRGWLGRTLGLNSDFLVTGQLAGCVIEADGICRDSVKIPLNLVDGRLTGGLHTSGTIAGGRKSMILTVTRLSLDRVTSAH
jgi:hypothetical protein